MIRIECGDCLEVMGSLPDNSVDLIATDPPYYRVKNLPWDRQWDKPAQFLAWIDDLCREWQRVLKPNGSLYVFASPKMAARVEVTIGEHFEVLQQIVWNKARDYAPGDKRGTAWKAVSHGSLRHFFPHTERIIFAEQFGADNHAKGEAGYASKCDELRGFVFEALRSYLDGELRAANVPIATVRDRLGFRGNMPFHWFARGFASGRASQWQLPTMDHYRALQSAVPGFFQRKYEDLRLEYEELWKEYKRRQPEYDALRCDYENLRRPFGVSPDVPYTDVWDFPTVQSYPGKHPCEKPLAMMRHIVRASSRPGAVLLDCFAGSGVTGLAAKQEGRSAILIEKDDKWVERMHARLAVTQEVQPKPKREQASDDLPLFESSRARIAAA